MMPDRAGKHGQRLLALGVEDSFGLEPLFQLLECELQRTRADRLHGFCDELHLAPLLIDADAAANQHVEAVLRPEAEKHCLAPEKYDGQLRLGVFQCEVNMARRGGTVIRNLALHPNVAIFLLDQFAHLRHKFANRPDAARRARLVEMEAQLGALVVIGREWIVRSH